MPGPKCATYKRATFDDAMEQEASLPGWTQEYRQFSSGDYSGITAAVEYPGVTILRERINVRTEQMFSAPKGQLIFYYYYGGPHRAGELVLGGPSATKTGFAWDWIDRVGFMHPRSDLLMVVLDPKSYGEPRSGSLLGAALTRAEHVAEWLGSVLQVFASGQGLGHAHDQLHAVLPDLIQDGLDALYEDGDLAGDARTDKAESIYRRLRDRVYEGRYELLTVSALARELAVPPVVLRRVCREFTDTQLDHILVQLRLNGARRSLIEAEGRDCRVCDVAMDWGFMHWSRFAARYRLLFGESPSVTLRRSAGRAHA